MMADFSSEIMEVSDIFKFQRGGKSFLIRPKINIKYTLPAVQKLRKSFGNKDGLQKL
jgi:hypothetical protein